MTKITDESARGEVNAQDRLASDLDLGRGAAENYQEIERQDEVINEYAGTTFFDCTDLVFYLAHHKMPSGIQRVTLQIFKEIFDRLPLWGGIEFIVFDKKANRYLVIDRTTWMMMVNHIIMCGVDDETQAKLQFANNGNWSIFKSRFVRSAEYKESRIFIIGAGWVFDSTPALAEARVAGASINLLVYDLIPLRRPEFFTRGTRAQFESWLKPMLAIADHVFAISKHAALDVAKFAEEIGLGHLPVKSLKLGTFQAAEQPDGDVADFDPSILGDYALFVSTIEARKNHVLLFRIWQELIGEGVSLPKLVFVGRMGWNIEELQRNLDQTNNLDGHIEILNDVSDFALAQLYRGAKFGVYPSWCEGWGLPVTEAIAAGSPVIASDATAIPEAGGSSAKYIAPDNYEEWKATVKQWSASTDPRQFVDLASFQVPKWSECLSELLRVRDSSVSVDNRLPRVPPITQGTEYSLAHQPHSREQGHVIASESLTYVGRSLPNSVFDIHSGRVGQSWNEREQWGSWTFLNKRAGLVLNVSQIDHSCTLLIYCQVVKEAIGMKVTITAGSDLEWEVNAPCEVFCISLQLGTDFSNVGTIDFNILMVGSLNQVRHIEATYSRPLGLGIRSVLVVNSTDQARWAQATARICSAGGLIAIAEESRP